MALTKTFENLGRAVARADAGLRPVASCEKHCYSHSDCRAGFAHCAHCPGTDLPAPYNKIRYIERGYDFDGRRWVADSSLPYRHDNTIRVTVYPKNADVETFEDIPGAPK